jgi:hypothetical protein
MLCLSLVIHIWCCLRYAVLMILRFFGPKYQHSVSSNSWANWSGGEWTEWSTVGGFLCRQHSEDCFTLDLATEQITFEICGSLNWFWEIFSIWLLSKVILCVSMSAQTGRCYIHTSCPIYWSLRSPVISGIRGLGKLKIRINGMWRSYLAIWNN